MDPPPPSLPCSSGRDAHRRFIDSVGMHSLLVIKELAAKQFGTEPDAMDADAPVDQLGIDSLGFLEFLFELEDHFGFPIPQERVKSVRTLRELADVIDSLPATATPPTTI